MLLQLLELCWSLKCTAVVHVCACVPGTVPADLYSVILLDQHVMYVMYVYVMCTHTHNYNFTLVEFTIHFFSSSSSSSSSSSYLQS